MTKDDVNLKELAEKRRLKILHIIMASFLAQLAEMGYLNQGSTNIIGTAVGKRVGKFLKDSNVSFDNGDELKVLREVVETIDLTEEITFEKNTSNKILVKLKSSMCKYCPKGVGGAEIPGTVCSVPYFLRSVLETILEKKYIVVPWEVKEHSFVVKKPLKKEEGHCIFVLQSKEQIE